MEEIASRLFDVRGQRAVVTGAASGLGLAFAEVLADCGARVTLADFDAERLEAETARLAASGADVRSTLVDVADPASVDACFAGRELHHRRGVPDRRRSAARPARRLVS